MSDHCGKKIYSLIEAAGGSKSMLAVKSGSMSRFTEDEARDINSRMVQCDGDDSPSMSASTRRDELVCDKSHEEVRT